MSSLEDQVSTGFGFNNGSQYLSEIRGNASSQFVQSNNPEMYNSDGDDDDEESMTKFRQDKAEEESSSNDDDDEGLPEGFPSADPLFKDFSEDSSVSPRDNSNTDNPIEPKKIDTIQLSELQNISKENTGQKVMTRKPLPIKETPDSKERSEIYKNVYSKLESKSQGLIPPPSGKASTDRVVVKALTNDLTGSNDDANDIVHSQRPADGKESNYRIRYCSRTKPNVIPPPPRNFYKKENFWTGSEFAGEFEDGVMFLGVYKYPTGSVYESEFLNGQIHSGKHNGRIKFPRGDIFEGQWVKGRLVNGKILFVDGLEYSDTNWGYLASGDKRLQSEKAEGFSKSMHKLKSNPVQIQMPNPNIPDGCYDTGDGIFNPETCQVINYEGKPIRKASESECCRIMKNCHQKMQFEPGRSFLPSRIPGSSVIDKNP